MITDINAQSERILGYKQEDLIYNSIKVLIPGDQQNIHDTFMERYFMDPSIRKMGEVSIDFQCIKADGSKLDVIIALAGLISETEALIIIRDNTDKINKRNKLKKYLKDKDDFMTLLGLEIKTPLFNIIGLSDNIIDDDLTNLNTYSNALEVRKNASHLLRINSNLINTNVFNHNEYQLLNEDIHLKTLINSEIEQFKYDLLDKNIDISIEGDDITIHSDIELL